MQTIPAASSAMLAAWLLELHPRAAAEARTPVGKLIEWMMKFQFDDEVDYFGLDPVAHAPALGDVDGPSLTIVD